MSRHFKYMLHRGFTTFTSANLAIEFFSILVLLIINLYTFEALHVPILAYLKLISLCCSSRKLKNYCHIQEQLMPGLLFHFLFSLHVFSSCCSLPKNAVGKPGSSCLIAILHDRDCFIYF